MVDLDLPEAELRRRTEAFCRTRPGFKSIKEWQGSIARRIAAHIER